MDIVRQSELFRSLAAAHANVDVWDDSEFDEGGCSYFWIVSKFEPASYRILAYVRLKDGIFEKRTYDQNGDDLWVAAD